MSGPLVDGVSAADVVRPASVEEAAAAVREADERGLAIVATGRGRHLSIGAPPERLDLLLCTERLAAVREHAAADMTVTVEAGVTLGALAQVLAAAGQELPLDPPAPDDTTVGGLIAANLSGPLRASQGTVRDLLLGLRWIAPDGTIVRGGGRVVKNVAGYDLPKAHVGALGTLGVLVEATFKVRPRPPHERALVVRADSASGAASLALAVRDAVEPDWLEIAAPLDVEGASLAHAVAAGYRGLAEELAEAERRARRVADGRVVATLDDAAAGALRRRLAEFALAPAAAVVRAATLPDRLGALLEQLATAGGEAPCVAHAANGVVRCAVGSAAAAVDLVRELRPRLAAAGGTLVVERATPDVKQSLRSCGGVWGDPGPAGELMRRLKEAFDPRRRFAPGRFVKEI